MIGGQSHGLSHLFPIIWYHDLITAMSLSWHTLFGSSDINHGIFGVTMNQNQTHLYDAVV